MLCKYCPITEHLDIGSNDPEDLWCPIIQESVFRDSECDEEHVLEIEKKIVLWREHKDG